MTDTFDAYIVRGLGMFDVDHVKMTMSDICIRRKSLHKAVYDMMMQIPKSDRPDHVIYYAEQYIGTNREFYFYDNVIPLDDDEFYKRVSNCDILFVGALHKGTSY